MLINYIPQIIEFKHVSNDKYENCPTREEHKEQQSNGYGKNVNTYDLNGYIQINPQLLISDENELFAGDNIIGYYSENGKCSMCLYQWKRNNPRTIIAYCLLLKLEERELINNEIQLVDAWCPNDTAHMLDIEKRKKLLITL